MEDETVAPRVVGRRRLLTGGRAFGLIVACMRSPRGVRSCVSRGSGSICPSAGEPRLPLRVHGVVAELEFVPSQRLLLLQSEHEHGGGERREVEELLGRVRP
jgi:hypothetical protein